MLFLETCFLFSKLCNLSVAFGVTFGSIYFFYSLVYNATCVVNIIIILCIPLVVDWYTFDTKMTIPQLPNLKTHLYYNTHIHFFTKLFKFDLVFLIQSQVLEKIPSSKKYQLM